MFHAGQSSAEGWSASRSRHNQDGLVKTGDNDFGETWDEGESPLELFSPFLLHPDMLCPIFNPQWSHGSFSTPPQIYLYIYIYIYIYNLWVI